MGNSIATEEEKAEEEHVETNIGLEQEDNDNKKNRIPEKIKEGNIMRENVKASNDFELSEV